MKGLILLVAVGAAAVYMWLQLGGGVDATAPNTQVPNVDPPSANEAARGAKDGANTLADNIAGLSPTTWQVITLLGLAGLAVYLWNKYPPLKYGVIGVAVFVGIVVMFF